jgi:flagellar hook-basal body complex protein FliE
MPIDAIGAVSATGAGGAVRTAATAATATASGETGAGVSGTGGAAFGDVLAGTIDNLQQLQGTADQLAVKAVTGDLSDVHDATIAATRAQVTLEVVAAVRNKAVEAFNDIMRMQA